MGRRPSTRPSRGGAAMRCLSTAVRITDPLVQYRSLVATGVYAPDPAQHRLARQLRAVYLRLKDYAPRPEYRQRLARVAPLADTEPPRGRPATLARWGHSIWRNPLFGHLLPSAPEAGRSLALTRVLTSHQNAVQVDSPKGLFLSGEVGTGKSMLLDLLADGLPTRSKRRWHFNAFMLYALSSLESHRKAAGASGAPLRAPHADQALLWLATKLVDESPILFLDEFQLPDRAASKLLTHLFIFFFQLGGVLVASSNRMPEELQRATGVDDGAAPSRGLVRSLFGRPRARGQLVGPSRDFGHFLEALTARCDFWQMDGAHDWRRGEQTPQPAPSCGERSQEGSALAPVEEMPGQDQDRDDGGAAAHGLGAAEDRRATRTAPSTYFLSGKDDAAWTRAVESTVSWNQSGSVPWAASTLVVYGRQVQSPQHYKGVVFWNFDDLVASFGPADYITMACSYHTFIVDRVPTLTTSKKNEARRFITLLDALYEARCKLMIRAQSPPDDLFFPARRRPSLGWPSSGRSAEDVTYSETMAEIYQDQNSPFRPNTSCYDSPWSAGSPSYDPDQHSGLGLQKAPVDFADASAFTGEDERFAYKRAVSRLWQLCSAQWHARTGSWWQPLPLEARHWEGGAPCQPVRVDVAAGQRRSPGEGMGESVEVDEAGGLSKWRVEHLKKQEGDNEP